MAITQKPPEILQAQTAAFIHERPLDFRDKDQLFSRLGELTSGTPKNLVIVNETPATYRNQAGEWEEMPAGTARTVATKEEYIQFLRDKGGASHEDIQGRTELLRAYDEFAPTVDALKQELVETSDPEEHPAYIGGGVSSRAFAIRHNEREYVAIIPRFQDTAVATLDSRIAGAVRAHGLPRLEQMVAASYANGVTISERLPGRSLNNLTADEVYAIPTAHFTELLNTVRAAHQKRVGIDFVADGSNFLYDSVAGFSIVDPHSAAENMSLSHMINKLADTVALRGGTTLGAWLRKQGEGSS